MRVQVTLVRMQKVVSTICILDTGVKIVILDILARSVKNVSINYSF